MAGRLHDNSQEWSRLYFDGCLAVIGVPILLLGLCLMVGPLLPGQEIRGPWFLLSLAGTLPVAFGIWAVFKRRGLKIDRESRTVTRWWGLLKPMYSRQQPLSNFQHVALRREIWGGPKHPRTVYTVRLAAHRHTILVDGFQAYPDARRLAEELSAFCALELADDTSGEMVVRDHQQLNWSLRQRRRSRRAEGKRRKRPTATLSTRPSDSPAESPTTDRQVVFELPHRIPLEPGRVSLIAAIFLGAWFAYAVSGSFRDVGDIGQPLGPPEVILGCLMGLAVVLLVRAGWRALGPAGRLKVTASRSELICEQYGLLGHRTRTMRADELEELTITDRGIMARSDQQTIAFGAGLPVHELKRIHAELVALLG